MRPRPATWPPWLSRPGKSLMEERSSLTTVQLERELPGAVRPAASGLKGSRRVTVRWQAIFLTPQQGGERMLVLTRRVGETIVIDDEIRVTIVSVRGERVRLGITAPRLVQVDREEIHERRTESKSRPEQLEAV